MTSKSGSLTVVCGPMFAGKTEELMRLMRRYEYSKNHPLIVKPSIDTRQAGIRSHNDRAMPAVVKRNLQSLLGLNVNVIGVDEFQFFTVDDANIVLSLYNESCTIVVSGLDLDFDGKPFESLATLMPYADRVVKLTAICTVCCDDATRSYRKIKSSSRVTIGATTEYEARCLSCWTEGRKDG